MEIIYACIAYDNSIIMAEHGVYEGNDPRKLSLKIMQTNINPNEKGFVDYDKKFTFYYLNSDRITYIVSCTADYPQDAAFQLIDDLAQIFNDIIQPEDYTDAQDGCLQSKFKDTISGKIEHFTKEPKSNDTLGGLKENLIDYKNILVEANIDIYNRGQTIDNLGDKANQLQNNAGNYHRAATKVKKNEKKKKIWVITAIVLIIVGLTALGVFIGCGWKLEHCISSSE